MNIVVQPNQTALARVGRGGWGRQQLPLSPNRFHRILQVIGRLDPQTGVDPLESARAVVVDWLRRKKGGWKIDDRQASGSPPVEIEVEDSTRALFIESAPGLWAVRLIDPCAEVSGRQWRVELVLVDMHDGRGPAFGCTLSVLIPSGADGMVGTPGPPGVIGKLAQSHGLSEGGFRLDGTVWPIDRPVDVDRLVAFIESPVRKVPVVVVSTPRHGEGYVDTAKIARGLAGLSLVVSLSADGAQELTERYGRALGVFGSALRMYRVGFNADIDTWERHPLYTPLQWRRRVRELERNLKLDAMEDSVSTRDENRDVPSFSFIRRIATDQRIKALAADVGSGGETSALEAEITRLQHEATAWEKTALDEERNAQKALEAQRQTRARLYLFAARIEALEAKLAELGDEMREPNPESFEELGDWAEKNLSGHLVITPKAERAARRSTHEDISHVYNCLHFLGTTYRDMKRGIVSKDLCEQQLAALNVRVSPTGKAADMARLEGEYHTMWEGQRYKLDMHLAGSPSRDGRYGLRIYFAWDDEQELVVVGHLPEHLTNSQS